MKTRRVRALAVALAFGAVAGTNLAIPSNRFGSASQQQPTAGAATRQDYLVYRNERFGFSIKYPVTFRLSDPPANGDGIGFIPPDGIGDFRAYAGFNAFGQTGQQMFEDAAREITEAGGLVTYAILTATGFVVSGTIGDKIRYQHIVLSDARGHSVAPTAPTEAVVVINSFWAEYPTSRKQEYDPVVAAMSRSLRPGVAAM